MFTPAETGSHVVKLLPGELRGRKSQAGIDLKKKKERKRETNEDRVLSTAPPGSYFGGAVSAGVLPVTRLAGGRGEKERGGRLDEGSAEFSPLQTCRDRASSKVNL